MKRLIHRLLISNRFSIWGSQSAYSSTKNTPSCIIRNVSIRINTHFIFNKEFIIRPKNIFKPTNLKILSNETKTIIFRDYTNLICKFC